MPGLSTVPRRSGTGFQFAVALSRNIEPEAAARDVSDQLATVFGEAETDLACLFFSPHHREAASRLNRVVRNRLHPRVLIGCSGEGVVAGGEEVESAPALTLWGARLPGVTVDPLRVDFSPVHDQLRMPGWPDDGDADGSFLVLADPFTTPLQQILTMLNHRYPGVPAIGGLAGGGQDAGENRLLLQDEVLDAGLVGVRLAGPLHVRALISQGCRPIGDRYVVTKAEHNVIHELSGTPALACLERVIESLGSEPWPTALHIGIVIDEQRNRFERGDFLVRNLVGADRATGSLAVGDLVQEGQTVQFHLRDGSSASEDLHLMLAADRAHHPNRPLGALMFTCCGRGKGLFGIPDHDAGAVAARWGGIPVAGFFAQGEIGPVGRRNFVHGYTASLAVFAEHQSP